MSRRQVGMWAVSSLLAVIPFEAFARGGGRRSGGRYGRGRRSGSVSSIGILILLLLIGAFFIGRFIIHMLFGPGPTIREPRDQIKPPLHPRMNARQAKAVDKSIARNHRKRRPEPPAKES